MVNSFTVRKLRLVGLVLIGLGFLAGFAFFLIGYLKPKVAGIHIEANPAATVYINQEMVGRTPYEATIAPGEVVVRLIPDSFQTPLAPYETKVNLASGVKTVIRRDFGELDETSAGETISFEKIGKGATGLSVVTIPDSAQLIIDGVSRAFTPHKVTLSPGEHTLTVSAGGFVERTVEVKTHEGYQLTAIVKLAKAPQVEASETEEPKEIPEEEREEAKDEVEILETSVGFLRVRSEPSTLGEEVARVTPGSRYTLLETDERTGWYKIEYKEGESGWISNQYAKKVQASSGTPAALPSATLKVSPTKTPTPKPTATPTS